MDITNFNNPFMGGIEDDLIEKKNNRQIHVRRQQRNGRKCITLIEGLGDEFDLKRMLKKMKKRFACNGSICKDEEFGNIINLQGEHRNEVKEFLVNVEQVVNEEDIKVHGY
jgi:translation initiation factor 1